MTLIFLEGIRYLRLRVKATINLSKLLLGFQSILFLMPSTQHTQACVFKKTTAKLVLFWYFQQLEINDQDQEPSEKLDSQTQEQV